MQASMETVVSRAAAPGRAALLVLLALGVALTAGGAGPLWREWRADSSLAHGPFIPLIAVGMLWARRGQLRAWNAADGAGLACLALSALLHVGAVWADIFFLVPVSWIGMVAGTAWFLGGRRAIAACAGALGFLVFMVPWPTTLVERLTFPMQLMSSTYAALLGGLLGLEVQRSGVELAVLAQPGGPPTYSILVAQKCSGLASLGVLLALGYLAAMMTPVKWGWRAAMVATVVPLTLLANAVRLTAVLYVGARHGAAAAQWVHDNEQPVLVLLCGAGLVGLRAALMAWTRPRVAAREPRDDDAAPTPAAYR